MGRVLKLCIALLASTVLAESVTITQKEFNDAATKNGFKTPPREYYDYFVAGASKYSKEEQAMLLAQLLHESQGLQLTEETACSNPNKCQEYRPYYGRGFIHITWDYNYKAASEALGLGDKLLRQPELVASDKKLAMLVSIWYWDANVHPQLEKKGYQFGVTTYVINSGECRFPKNHPKAQIRWNRYLKVAEALGIINKPKESGCYN